MCLCINSKKEDLAFSVRPAGLCMSLSLPPGAIPPPAPSPHSHPTLAGHPGTPPSPQVNSPLGPEWTLLLGLPLTAPAHSPRLSQDHWPRREATGPAVTVQVAQALGGLTAQGLAWAWSSVPELVMLPHHMQERRPPKAASHLRGWHSRAPPGTKRSDLRHMGREAQRCPHTTDPWTNPSHLHLEFLATDGSSFAACAPHLRHQS